MPNSNDEHSSASEEELDLTIVNQEQVSELQKQIRKLQLSLEVSEKERLCLKQTLATSASMPADKAQTSVTFADTGCANVTSTDHAVLPNLIHTNSCLAFATAATSSVNFSPCHLPAAAVSAAGVLPIYANANLSSAATHQAYFNSTNNIAAFTSADVYTTNANYSRSFAGSVPQTSATFSHSYFAANPATTAYTTFSRNFGGFDPLSPPLTAHANVNLAPGTNTAAAPQYSPLQPQVPQIWTPTYQQPSVRKLHDLPDFYGSPEEWPMFSVAFKETTAMYSYTNFENLIRLQKSLKGNARSRVESLLIHPSSVNAVLSSLEFYYGRPELLIRSQLAKARAFPAITNGKLNEIVNLSSMVSNLAAFLENAGATPHLSNPTLLDELVSKLPQNKREEWARHTFAINKVYPSIREFSTWLQQVSMFVIQAAENISIKQNVSCEPMPVKFSKNTKPVFTINEEKGKCVFCRNEHKLYQCKQFKESNYDMRWECVKKNRLCFCCLSPGHSVQNCLRHRECGIENCKRYHNRLLHNTNAKGTKICNAVSNDISVNSTSAVQTVSATADCMQNNVNKKTFNYENSFASKSLLKFMPVRLRGPNGILNVIAFIDDGAKVTLLEEEIASKLGLKGAASLLRLRWIDNKTTSEMSKNVSAEIAGTHSRSRFFDMRGVRTTKKLFLPEQTLNLNEFRKQFKELCNIPLEDYTNAVPQILIGVPHMNLVRALNVFNFDDNFTIHETKLGYTLFGSNENEFDCANVCNVDIEKNILIDLQKQVTDYFALEGFEPQQSTCIQSECDKRAQRILEDTTKLVEQKYETGLLWKNDSVCFPESFSMCLKRLELVEKKMQHDEKYASWYNKRINEYVKKGYARKLSRTEAETSDERTWYLPHFAICNINKGNKPRLVFDAAAKINGVSLNSMLMKGPDAYHPKTLTTILFKFREGKIGICGDIKEMFHPINICKKDQNAQRFLWREGNQSKPPDVYAMNAMIFGSICSPCSAQFVKNMHASKFANEHPRAVDAIINFDDDYVDSFDSEDESINVTKKVIDIHASAGFELRGFASNSKRLLEALREDSSTVDSETKNMSVSDNTNDKVLGMFWNARSDEFYFNLKFSRIPKPVLEGFRHPTKAELLGLTMSIFDPFGFLAHVTLIPKILLQRLWHQNIGWHDLIPKDINDKWYKWYKEFDNLKDFNIPRCYFIKSKEIINDIQLHIFVDASEFAFAAVAYWRIDYKDEVSVVFIAGKSRCSPLKPLSIPRLELQSAVLGVRLMHTIISSHNTKPSQIIFWSDAKTVIQWVRSEARRYKPFVSNRISEILESSEVHQWRWVPGSLNPADDATRPQEKLNISLNCRWLNGPTFLKDKEELWPALPSDILENENKEEQRTKQLFTLQDVEDALPYTKFSNYYKFLKIMTWVRYAIMKFRKLVDNKSGVLKSPMSLSAVEVKKTELMIIRKVQLEIYSEEIKALQSGFPISKQSPLISLTPIIDEEGMMRLGGRIDYAKCLPMETRRPIIMPKCHNMTRLIVKHYHEIMYHQNQDAIICAIRSKFWIPCIRQLLRLIRNECQLCKNLSAQPKAPLMGQIPVDRLTPYIRPFSFTGLDYFGPIMVSIGRRREKRWVALFTCLSIRAVHLELARDLSTDAVILCLRNFVNRRGLPVRIRSDRGTNFIGASKVEWLKIEENIEKECIRRGIEWVFNTPANPSAGGIWERMVRSVKKVLKFTLKEVAPQVETLISLLIEAENLVNSRPLTHLPIDSIDADPLTPNHFILGCPNFIQTTAETENVCLRKQWRILQQLKQTFWRRWISEYLPTLTRRTKWHQRVKPIQIGDVVIVCDDNESRGEWKRGIVLEVFPAQDGQVRSALVKTSKGNLRRPASKLAVLDVSGEP